MLVLEQKRKDPKFGHGLNPADIRSMDVKIDVYLNDFLGHEDVLQRHLSDANFKSFLTKLKEISPTHKDFASSTLSDIETMQDNELYNMHQSVVQAQKENNHKTLSSSAGRFISVYENASKKTQNSYTEEFVDIKKLKTVADAHLMAASTKKAEEKAEKPQAHGPRPA